MNKSPKSRCLVCGECAADEVISAEIKTDGELGKCSFCKRRRKTISIEALAERVGSVYEEFVSTGAEEPEFDTGDDKVYYSQSGENPGDIIQEMLGCESEIAEAVADELYRSSRWDVHDGSDDL